MIQVLLCTKTCCGVTSDLRFNHALRLDNNHNNFFSMYTSSYSVCEVICVFQRITFCIFMLSKRSLDDNIIGDEGGVALGEALKVNKTLQTLR